MVKLSFCSVLEHGLDETVDLLNRGFSDYIVPIQTTIGSLLHGVRSDSVELGSSRIVQLDGEAVGAALVARRGWSCRLAAMALIPRARGQGIGRALVVHLRAEAEARDERRMLLEVIESNDPAVKLYGRCGFQTFRRLVGFSALGDLPAEDAPLQEIDPAEVAKHVATHGLPELPWQMSGEGLATVGPPNRAYQLDDASILISDPTEPQVVVRSLVVLPSARGQGQAVRLLKAIFHAYPQKKWKVPAFCPEEMSFLFEEVGFARETLSQLQMVNEWGTCGGP